MASTYSNLKIELIGTGDQSGTWGVTTNTNLGTAIEEAITGSADVAFSSADVTLTLTNVNTAQTARNLRLNLTGTSGGARNLIVPAIEKFYVIQNNCADTITVKNSTGTGIAVPAGLSTLVFNNGTDVVDAVSYLSAITVGGDSYFTSTGAVKVPAGTTAQQPGSPLVGMIRYNSTDDTFEGYTTLGWGSIGSGAVAGGAVYENKQQINSNYTMTTNYNGESVGPITIASGITVTIPSGSRWVVL